MGCTCDSRPPVTYISCARPSTRPFFFFFPFFPSLLFFSCSCFKQNQSKIFFFGTRARQQRIKVTHHALGIHRSNMGSTNSRFIYTGQTHLLPRETRAWSRVFQLHSTAPKSRIDPYSHTCIYVQNVSICMYGTHSEHISVFRENATLVARPSIGFAERFCLQHVCQPPHRHCLPQL